MARYRRRFIQLAGTGAAVSVAGCAELGSTDDEPDADDGDDELPGDGGEIDVELDSELTAIVQPTDEQFQALQEEVLAEAEEEGLDQQQIQQRLQEAEQELFVEVGAEFEALVDDDGELSITDATPEQGAFLLDASDERLIETLRAGEVDALLPGEEYIELLEALAAQPDPEDLEPDDEDLDDQDPDDGES